MKSSLGFIFFYRIVFYFLLSFFYVGIPKGRTILRKRIQDKIELFSGETWVFCCSDLRASVCYVCHSHNHHNKQKKQNIKNGHHLCPPLFLFNLFSSGPLVFSEKNLALGFPNNFGWYLNALLLFWTLESHIKIHTSIFSK